MGFIQVCNKSELFVIYFTTFNGYQPTVLSQFCSLQLDSRQFLNTAQDLTDFELNDYPQYQHLQLQTLHPYPLFSQ